MQLLYACSHACGSVLHTTISGWRTIGACACLLWMRVLCSLLSEGQQGSGFYSLVHGPGPDIIEHHHQSMCVPVLSPKVARR